MGCRHLGGRLAVVLATALAASTRMAPLVADAVGSKHDAEVLLQKIAVITALGDHPSTELHQRTVVTEQEVNAYLAYEAGPQLPPGVIEPMVTIVGDGRLAVRATVDLDAVRRQKNPTSRLDPMYYLTGRLPVTATGTLRTSNGIGRVDVESTSVGGVPVPKRVLQEIVGYYSRTPENPQGMAVDDPFMLPSGIREIQVERGQAIVVQ